MNIQLSQIADAYLKNREAITPQDGGGVVQNIAFKFEKTLETSEQTAISAMTKGINPHDLVQALTQTELAVEAAVTIRDKVVNAYQEILRMPV